MKNQNLCTLIIITIILSLFIIAILIGFLLSAKLYKYLKIWSEQLIAPAITLINITVLFFLHYTLIIYSNIGLNSTLTLLAVTVIASMVFLYLSIFVLVLLYKTCEYITENKYYLLLHWLCKPALIFILFSLVISQDNHLYMPEDMALNLITVSNIYKLLLGNITFIILFILICIFSHALFLNFKAKHSYLYTLLKDLLTLLILYIKKHGIRKSFKKMKRKVKYFYDQALIWKNTKKSPEDRAKFIKGVMVLMVLILVVMLIKIIFRLSIMYLLNDSSSTSSLLSLVLVLPIGAYIFNLSIKCFIIKKVEKKDWRFFNDNVIKATNLYIIVWAIFMIYLVSYSLEFASLFFTLLCKNMHLGIRPLNIVNVRFSNEIVLDTNGEGWWNKPTTNYDTENLSPRPLTQVDPKPKKEMIKTIKNSKVMSQLADYSLRTDKPFLPNSMIVSHNLGLGFTSARDIMLKDTGNAALVIAIKLLNSELSTNQDFWGESKITHRPTILQQIEIAKNLGINLNLRDHIIEEFTWLMPMINPINKSLLPCYYNPDMRGSVGVKPSKPVVATWSLSTDAWNGKMDSLIPNLKLTDLPSIKGTRGQILLKRDVMSQLGMTKHMFVSHRNFAVHVGYINDTSKLEVNITKASLKEHNLPFFSSYVYSPEGIDHNLKSLQNLGVDLNLLGTIMPKTINLHTQAEYGIKEANNSIISSLRVFRLSHHYIPIPYLNLYPSLLLNAKSPLDNVICETKTDQYQTAFMQVIRDIIKGLNDMEVGALDVVSIQILDKLVKNVFKDIFMNDKSDYNWDTRDRSLLPNRLESKDYDSAITSFAKYRPDERYTRLVQLYTLTSHISTLSSTDIHGTSIIHYFNSEDRYNLIKSAMENLASNAHINEFIRANPINLVLQDRLYFELLELRYIAEKNLQNTNMGLYSIVRLNPGLIYSPEYWKDSQYYDQTFNLTKPSTWDAFVYFINQAYNKKIFDWRTN